jgi:hypothetical protein
VKSALGLLVATLISGAAIGAGADSTAGIPPLDPGILLVEGSGAVLGGAACAAGLGFLLARMYDPSEDVWKTFGGTVLGGSLGYPLFCGLGCWASAKLVSQQGTLGGAIVGALAAAPVALTVAWVGTLVEHSPPGSLASSSVYVAAALIPPAGAVVGYNLSRPRPTKVSTARLDWPEVLLRTETGENGTRRPMLDVRLVNARF